MGVTLEECWQSNTFRFTLFDRARYELTVMHSSSATASCDWSDDVDLVDDDEQTVLTGVRCEDVRSYIRGNFNLQARRQIEDAAAIAYEVGAETVGDVAESTLRDFSLLFGLMVYLRQPLKR